MAFARAEDHLDHDEIRLSELLVPRPASSAVYRVRDDRLVPYGIFPRDIAIIERDQRLRPGAMALVSVEGKSRLVRILQDGGRMTFEDLPPHDVSVDVIGVATRVLRVLVP
jgi:SOS-response transcriptional repressor LexA